MGTFNMDIDINPGGGGFGPGGTGWGNYTPYTPGYWSGQGYQTEFSSNFNNTGSFNAATQNAFQTDLASGMLPDYGSSVADMGGSTTMYSMVGDSLMDMSIAHMAGGPHPDITDGGIELRKVVHRPETNVVDAPGICYDETTGDPYSCSYYQQPFETEDGEIIMPSGCPPGSYIREDGSCGDIAPQHVTDLEAALYWPTEGTANMLMQNMVFDPDYTGDWMPGSPGAASGVGGNMLPPENFNEAAQAAYEAGGDEWQSYVDWWISMQDADEDTWSPWGGYSTDG